MKTTKFKAYMLILMFILFSVFLYSFINPGTGNKQSLPFSPVTTNSSEQFLIGAMQSYHDLTHHDELGLNITHVYDTSELGQIQNHTTWATPISPVNLEHLFDAVPTSTIQSELNEIYLHRQSRIFWMRPKIEWLAYGRSSIYKAYQDNPDYWFYGFNYTSGSFEPDNGITVLHCGLPTNGANAKFVLQGLTANTEQS